MYNMYRIKIFTFIYFTENSSRETDFNIAASTSASINGLASLFGLWYYPSYWISFELAAACRVQQNSALMENKILMRITWYRVSFIWNRTLFVTRYWDRFFNYYKHRMISIHFRVGTYYYIGFVYKKTLLHWNWKTHLEDKWWGALDSTLGLR